jgi:hypothetical protein
MYNHGMKKICYFLVLSIAFLSCGKSEPGEINVSLKFDSSVTSSIRNSIKDFIFLVGESGGTQKLIYPSGCLGCSVNSSSCPKDKICLKSNSCGFPSTAGSFDPQINFSDLAEGKSLEIVSCAMNASTQAVSSGKNVFKNTGGTKVNVTMTSGTTDCINNLPALVCP